MGGPNLATYVSRNHYESGGRSALHSVVWQWAFTHPSKVVRFCYVSSAKQSMVCSIFWVFMRLQKRWRGKSAPVWSADQKNPATPRVMVPCKNRYPAKTLPHSGVQKRWRGKSAPVWLAPCRQRRRRARAHAKMPSSANTESACVCVGPPTFPVTEQSKYYSDQCTKLEGSSKIAFK